MEINNVRVNTERLENLNNGINFLNIDNQEQERYYIKVSLYSNLTLKSNDEKIKVDSNLPFISWSYYETEVDSFFKQLDKFCKNPLAVVNLTNRKEKISSYELHDIKSAIRNITIDFKDIDFEIGELAEKKLKFNFIEKVKKILKQQKVNRDVQSDVDRFCQLKEKILTLKSFREKDDYWGSSRKRDETERIRLTPQEHNKQLRVIEIEMIDIAEKFGTK